MIKLKWYAILQVVMWVLSKVMQDENNNGKPDIFEGENNEVQTKTEQETK